MDIDCNLAFVDIFWVIIDHDTIQLSILAKKCLRSHHFVISVASWNANDIQELLLDNSVWHQPLQFSLFLSVKALRLRGTTLYEQLMMVFVTLPFRVWQVAKAAWGQGWPTNILAMKHLVAIAKLTHWCVFNTVRTALLSKWHKRIRQFSVNFGLTRTRWQTHDVRWLLLGKSNWHIVHWV